MEQQSLLPQMIQKHLRSIPSGMTLRQSNATSDEGRKYNGTLAMRSASTTNPMMCQINATCNSYTMTNNFSNEETLESLNNLKKQHKKLEEEHQRVLRKYHATKILLKQFVDIVDKETHENDKYAQITQLHAKISPLFANKRERDDSNNDDLPKKKMKTTK